MRLLRKPPSDLADVPQIFRFAQSNRIILEVSKHYSADELREIAKYRDFFRDMERAARSVSRGTQVAEVHRQRLKNGLSARFEEAERERERTGSEGLRSLYDYFIGHHDCLTVMVSVVVQEQRNSEEGTDGLGKRGENRNSYDTRERNDVTPNFSSRPEDHVEEVKTLSNDGRAENGQQSPPTLSCRTNAASDGIQQGFMPNQASNLEENTHGSECSKIGELSGTEGNPKAVNEDDQNSIFQSSAKGNMTDYWRRKKVGKNIIDEEIAESGENGIPNSQNHDLRDNGIKTVVVTERQGQDTASKADQGFSLDFLPDGEGNILRTEGRNEVGKRSVGSETTESLTIAMSETKYSQTEEVAASWEKRFEVGNEASNPQSHNLKQHSTPGPTEEGDYASSHNSGSPIEQVQEEGTRNVQRNARTNAKFEIAREVTVESIPKTFPTQVTGAVTAQQDPVYQGKEKPVLFSIDDAGTSNSGIRSPLGMAETEWEELQEELRRLKHENDCSNPDRRGNTTETRVKQVVETEIGSSVPLVKQTSADLPLFKQTSVHRAAFQEDTGNELSRLISGSKLRTLEDCLKAFGLFPRLLGLEESLEKVRRGKRTPAEHKDDCKLFDKELVRLSLEHHPDRVMRDGGSQEEVTRAKEMQTALNATRTVLKILNGLFLQDTDVELRYHSFAELDIGMLGNEDDTDCHSYRVLFQIILVSEIQQQVILDEIRRFLQAAQLCLDSYVNKDFSDFREHRDSAFSHLEKCLAGYSKLHEELESMESECERDNLSCELLIICRRMRDDCSSQLKHVEGLLEVTKRPFGEMFPFYAYSASRPVPDDLVLPLVIYVDSIMACSVFVKRIGVKQPFFEALTRVSQQFMVGMFIPYIELASQIFLPSPDRHEGPSAAGILYRVASYYVGEKQYVSYVEDLVSKRFLRKKETEDVFFVLLNRFRENFRNSFKIDNYAEKDVVKELDLCRAMKQGLEKKKEHFASGRC